MKSVEELDVFKLAHQLALKRIRQLRRFQEKETFSLVDQMRRAATSVGMNLMEVAMRLGTKEYLQIQWHMLGAPETSDAFPHLLSASPC
jgi:hypothetical protein